MSERPARKTELAQLSVLVADASLGMAELLAAALKGVGVGRVTKTTGSDAALRALSSRKFDALIVDLTLGPLSATELTLKLRSSQGHNAHTPVVALGSSLSGPMISQALHAGATAMLTKPVSAETLRRRLVDLVRTPSEPTFEI